LLPVLKSVAPTFVFTQVRAASILFPPPPPPLTGGTGWILLPPAPGESGMRVPAKVALALIMSAMAPTKIFEPLVLVPFVIKSNFPAS
jgi:hypothetical protein